MASHDAASTNVAMIMKERTTQRSTPDSAVPNPVNGKSHSRQTDGPSNLDKILDRPYQIHGHPDEPANYTNKNGWVFKQASKLNAEHKGRRPPGDRDDGDVYQPNTGGQKKFPPEVKTVNMHGIRDTRPYRGA